MKTSLQRSLSWTDEPDFICHLHSCLQSCPIVLSFCIFLFFFISVNCIRTYTVTGAQVVARDTPESCLMYFNIYLFRIMFFFFFFFSHPRICPSVEYGHSSDDIIVGVALLGDWLGLIPNFHFIAKHGVRFRLAFFTSSRSWVDWLIDKHRISFTSLDSTYLHL